MVAPPAPEHKIRFDAYGGPRQADLAFVTSDYAGRIAVTLEGKADESFDSYVGEVLANAVDRGLLAASNGVRRVEELAASLLPARTRRPNGRALPPLRMLRYQLMTAVAGTLAYARDAGADRAVLIVEEFVTDRTDDRLHSQNQRDLDRFLERLTGGEYGALPPDRLAGPIRVPGAPLFASPAALYLGKVIHDLRRVPTPAR